jgi:Condensation domain/TubC N-terminal docking domain
VRFAELMRVVLLNDVRLHADGDVLHYDAPDGVVTEELRAELRRHKPALLSWLTTHDPYGQVVSRALPPYIQQEWWHRNQSSPASTVYTVGLRIHFGEGVDAAALEEALNWLVTRHETLRTRFTTYRDGDIDQPVQEVLVPERFPLAVTDLSEIPDGDQCAVLDQHCGQIIERPFSPAQAPLWRVRLFVLGQRRHLLLWTLHHIICDGWSLQILLDELLSAYAAARAGRSPQCAPVQLTYSGYARWQRRHLAGRRLDELVGYWRRTLSGAPMTLDLPYDHPAPARLSGRGAAHEFTVSAAILAQVERVAKQLHTTVYSVVLSGFALQLSDFTGQDEVVVPTSYANRHRQDHESVVGQVADRLPIRIRTAAADTFADLVEQVGETVFDAVDHALPLRLLVSSLPDGQRPPAPYPTVLFTFLDERPEVRQSSSVSARVEFDSPRNVARMQLYCYLAVTDGVIRGAIEYSTDLFHAETISRFADQFIARIDHATAL